MPGAGQCQAALPTYSVLRFGGGAFTAVHRHIKSWAALPSPSKRGIQWPCERASCMQEYGRRASGMRARTVRISRHAYHKMKEGGLLVARSVSAFEFVGNRTAYASPSCNDLKVPVFNSYCWFPWQVHSSALDSTSLEAPTDRVTSAGHCALIDCRPPTLRAPVAGAREARPRDIYSFFSRGTTSITPPHTRSRRDTLLAIVSTIETNKPTEYTPVHEIENPTVYTAGHHSTHTRRVLL